MIPLFEANLYSRTSVGTDEQVSKLKEEILYYKSKEPTVKNSNPGCWRGQQTLETIGFLLEAIDEMVLQNIRDYSKRDNVFADNTSPDWRIVYWSNVNEPGSRNTMHSHSPSIFAGTYYLQGTGTGELRLVNPANVLSNCNPRSPFIRDTSVFPSDRDLLMWPAWVPHEVLTNFSDKQRINVAYDVVFKD